MDPEIQRSWMFVPGNSEKMLAKAVGLLNLDVAMFDLEDGVPFAFKNDARSLVPSFLAAPAGGPRRFVRLNAGDTGRIEADLAAVVVPGLVGVVIPKANRREDVTRVDQLLGELEQKGGIAPGTVQIVAAIESARGLLNAPTVAAASPRVLGLMFGAEDYSLDLWLPTIRVAEARELVYARSAVVNAAASAHVQAIDGVWPDFRDLEGTLRDALQARRLGFTGKSTFHPAQIDVINEAFGPSDEDVAYARRVVDAFEEAQAAGRGSAALGGQLIDRPIVERARRVLRTMKMSS